MLLLMLIVVFGSDLDVELGSGIDVDVGFEFDDYGFDLFS